MSLSKQKALPKCRLCQNHEPIDVRTKGHKCPYEENHSECEPCNIIKQQRSDMAASHKIMRKRKKDVSTNTSQPGDNLEEVKCSKCKNHKETKNHSRVPGSCPHRDCDCDDCDPINKRRRSANMVTEMKRTRDELGGGVRLPKNETVVSGHSGHTSQENLAVLPYNSLEDRENVQTNQEPSEIESSPHAEDHQPEMEFDAIGSQSIQNSVQPEDGYKDQVFNLNLIVQQEPVVAAIWRNSGSHHHKICYQEFQKRNSIEAIYQEILMEAELVELIEAIPQLQSERLFSPMDDEEMDHFIKEYLK